MAVQWLSERNHDASVVSSNPARIAKKAPSIAEKVNVKLSHDYPLPADRLRAPSLGSDRLCTECSVLSSCRSGSFQALVAMTLVLQQPSAAFRSGAKTDA